MHIELSHGVRRALLFGSALALLNIVSTHAATFHSIDSITSSTAATDLYPVANLIQGPGVGFDAADPHQAITVPANIQSWVTNAPGGFPSDYFDFGPTPVLTLDLGSDTSLSEISLWGYDDNFNLANSNSASEISLRFATETDGIGGFGTTIGYSPTFFLAHNNVDRQSFGFGQDVSARFVEVTVSDNHFGSPIIGGDRVGLGEIAFAVGAPSAVPEPSFGFSMIGLGLLAGLSRRRRRRGN